MKVDTAADAVLITHLLLQNERKDGVIGESETI